MWAAASSDLIATHFQVSLNDVLYILRTLFFIGPVIAFIVTKRICLGLQRMDREAVARRDALLRSRRLYAAIADAGTMTGSRYSRSEVRFVPAVDVKALRDMADSAAKAYRELDTKIQQLNWTTELL